MASFIKAYSNKDSTIFEMKVVAINEGLAKGRGALALLGKNPSQVPAVVNVDVKELPSDGYISEYRVMIEIESKGDLRDILKIDKAIREVEERL